MNPLIENAHRAIQVPEVQEMVKRLSDYGLGVFMPHLHPDEGGFKPLPRDMVQLERDLTVSFVNDNNPKLADAVPVGWVWDAEKVRVSASCYCCKGH